MAGGLAGQARAVKSAPAVERLPPLRERGYQVPSPPDAPGLAERASARTDRYLAALAAAGVQVSFDPDLVAPTIAYEHAGAPPALVVPGAWLCPDAPAACASRADALAAHVADGQPLLVALTPDDSRDLFSVVALTLPTFARDDPLPPAIEARVNAICAEADRSAHGPLYARQAEHFAGRLTARVWEQPPGALPDWEVPRSLVQYGPTVDVVFGRSAAADARLIETAAADVEADADRAAGGRDLAVDRFEGFLDAVRARGIPCSLRPPPGSPGVARSTPSSKFSLPCSSSPGP